RFIGFEPVVEGDRRLGTLYLKVDTGSTMTEWLGDSIRIALLVMAFMVLTAYLLSRWLQRQISLPILSLADTARQISEDRDFSRRARKYGNDEVGQLS